MAKRAPVALERGEHYAAFRGLMPVADEEALHLVSLARRVRGDIGTAP